MEKGQCRVSLPQGSLQGGKLGCSTSEGLRSFKNGIGLLHVASTQRPDTPTPWFIVWSTPLLDNTEVPVIWAFSSCSDTIAWMHFASLVAETLAESIRGVLPIRFVTQPQFSGRTVFEDFLGDSVVFSCTSSLRALIDSNSGSVTGDLLSRFFAASAS